MNEPSVGIPGGRLRRYQAAGVIAWCAAGFPAVYAAAQSPRMLAEARVLGWLAAYVLFGVVLAMLPAPTHGRRRGATGWLMLQTACALIANALLPMPIAGVALGGVLTVIVAAKLPLFTRHGGMAHAWMAAQGAGLAAAYALSGWPWRVAALAAAAYYALGLFAYAAARTAVAEHEGRVELSRVVAELRATRALLEESTRAAERARIGRELHDVLGHHLTALGLTLETASHVAEGRAAELVRRARGLCSLLLADVRAAIVDAPAGTEAEGVEIGEALRRLGANLPSPALHLEIGEGARRLNAGIGHVVFRCVQEFLTNAARHGRAANVRVRLARENGRLILEAVDDGAGAAAVTYGGGLSGMRSRVEEFGGEIEATTSPGHGYRLRIAIPAAAEARA